jgi:hypothetical protein
MDLNSILNGPGSQPQQAQGGWMNLGLMNMGGQTP